MANDLKCAARLPEYQTLEFYKVCPFFKTQTEGPTKSNMSLLQYGHNVSWTLTPLWFLMKRAYI